MGVKIEGKAKNKGGGNEKVRINDIIFEKKSVISFLIPPQIRRKTRLGEGMGRITLNNTQ